jgi:hypothetical protein
MQIRLGFLVFFAAASAAWAEGTDDAHALIARAEAIAPVDLKTALERFVLISEAVRVPAAPMATAEMNAKVEAAEADVARFCEGLAPGPCLLTQAEGLVSKVPAGKPLPGGAIATRSEVQFDVAIAWLKLGELDRAKSTAAGIEDARSRGQLETRFVAILAKRGKFVEALELAAEITRSLDQLDAMVWVAFYLIEAGKTDEALQALGIAEELARRLPKDLEWRDQSIARIALEYRRLDELGKAEAITPLIEDEFWTAAVLSQTARAKAKAGQLDEAAKTVAKITDRAEGREALQELITFFAREEHYSEAMELARAIDRPGDRAAALAAIAQAYFMADEKPLAEPLLAEAEAIADTEEDPFHRVQALKSLALARDWHQPDFAAEAKRIAAKIAGIDGEERAIAYALGEMAVLMERIPDRAAAEHLFQLAETAVLRISDPGPQSEAVGELAQDLAQAGLTAEAARVAQALDTPEDRARALAQAASGAAKAGRGSDVLQLAALIRQTGVAPAELAETLDRMARHLVEAGQFPEAEEIAASIDDAAWRDKALANLATDRAKAGGFVEANRIRQAIVDPGWQATAASGLVIALHRDD